MLKPCDEEYSEDDEYDSAYAVRIFKARDEIFKILDMPEMSINEKLVVILKYCASIQEYINMMSMTHLRSMSIHLEEVI